MNRSRDCILHAFLFLLLIWLPACEEPGDGLIDSVDAPPQLVAMEVVPSVVNTDTVYVGTTQTPDDVLSLTIFVTTTVRHPAGREGIRSVTASIADPDGRPVVDAQSLKPGPVLGEGGLEYAAELLLSVKRSEIGLFQAEASALSRSGLKSTTIRLPLLVTRLNSPPSLSHLSAPDTLTLGGSAQLVPLEIRAADPNGQDDIRRVQFNSFLPDGSPSRGNPFQMYDDGNTLVIAEPDVRSGDRVKDDSVYTLTILLPPTATPGIYRFEFQAFDRLNAASAIVRHTLVVRP